MGRNVIETLMGAVVLFIAASFIFISYKSGNISSDSGRYTVTAKFREIGSLSIGSDVRVGGIRVGSISNQYLDQNNFKAVVEMGINQDIKIPRDSSASVIGDGLLGGKYISIEPGGEEEYISSGGEIRYTQDSISLEELIGKFAFGSLDDKEGSSTKEDDLNGGLLDE
ncbi:MAG: outer membrane lipid asymmetry maintenance protein MlaD [Alphaproteobacteria bacterium CG11_big_fil_rev_8_21_14_0_20_39_49]|nr:MAG: outer membrane lipid asymmetry maintenance protein MlaD [Alphaproteobacteria bacterium CG11_big_fil_rev_8_21_14_0_20_39_49]